MSTWKLSTAEKKSCTQIEFFKKGELVAQREIGWRWCWARYSEKPDLSDYDPNKDQIELYSIGDVDDMEQDDGCWEEWTWPDDVDEEEVERLEEIYEEDGDEGLENEGWVLEDTEYWVSGPLDVEQEIQWYIDGDQPLVMVDRWTKDDLIVEQRITYAKTHAVFESEPDIAGYDPEEQIDISNLGIPVYNYRGPAEILEEWEFPEDMSKKEQKWFKENEWDKFTDGGWTRQNTQVWVTGELTITKDEEE
jgi:hypothetical protein